MSVNDDAVGYDGPVVESSYVEAPWARTVIAVRVGCISSTRYDLRLPSQSR